MSAHTNQGQALISDFIGLFRERLLALRLADSAHDVHHEQINQRKYEVLIAMRQEVEQALGVNARIKQKILSLIALEQQRFTFADRCKASSNPWLTKLKDAENDAYKLCINFSRHAQGRHQQEGRQEGYMAGMLSALNQTISTLQEPLSATTLQEMHDIAVQNVINLEDYYKNKTLYEYNLATKKETSVSPLPQGFGNRGCGAELKISAKTGYYASNAGISEFRNSLKFEAGWIKYHETAFGKGKLSLGKERTPQECSQKAAEIIAHYHENIAIAKRNYQDTSALEAAVLRSIAICCQDLLQHHLFAEHNIDAVAFLVMNKLLLQNDMAPAILDGANKLYMHSVFEIIHQIKQGQVRFKTLLNDDDGVHHATEAANNPYLVRYLDAKLGITNKYPHSDKKPFHDLIIAMEKILADKVNLSLIMEKEVTQSLEHLKKMRAVNELNQASINTLRQIISDLAKKLKNDQLASAYTAIAYTLATRCKDTIDDVQKGRKGIAGALIKIGRNVSRLARRSGEVLLAAPFSIGGEPSIAPTSLRTRGESVAQGLAQVGAYQERSWLLADARRQEIQAQFEAGKDTLHRQDLLDAIHRQAAFRTEAAQATMLLGPPVVSDQADAQELQLRLALLSTPEPIDTPLREFTPNSASASFADTEELERRFMLLSTPDPLQTALKKGKRRASEASYVDTKELERRLAILRAPEAPMGLLREN
jgi:hypothetical protein